MKTWILLLPALLVLSCSGSLQSPDDDSSAADDDSVVGDDDATSGTGDDDDVTDDDDTHGDDDSGNVSPFVGEYGGQVEIRHLTDQGPVTSCIGAAHIVVTEAGDLTGTGDCQPDDPQGNPVPVVFEGGVAGDGVVKGQAIHRPPDQEPEAFPLTGLFEPAQFTLEWNGTMVSQAGEMLQFEGVVIGQPL